MIESAYVDVTITIDAAMDSLGGSPTSAILGQAGTQFIFRDFGSGLASTW